MKYLLLPSFAFAARAHGFDHAHRAWDALLRKHVVLIDGGSREQYFAGYAKLLADDPGHQKRIAQGKAPLAHLDYDWSLNDSRSSSPR